MAIRPKAHTDFEPAPPGSWPARCYRVIELGTIREEYQGESKVQHKVLLGWELPTKLMQDGRPMMVSRIFTASLHPKGNLRPFLVNWRGREFTADEERTFSLEKLAGQPCTLMVVEKARRDGSMRSVANTAFPPQGEVPPAMNPVEVFDWENPDLSLLEALSPGVQAMVRSSQEYARSRGLPWPAPVQAAQVPPKPWETQGVAGPMAGRLPPGSVMSPTNAAMPADFDDDIPW